MNNKKRIIFISVIAILIAITSLYVTYATNTTEEQTSEYDMSLSFDLTGDTSGNITVAAGYTKVFDFEITNPYEGEVKYGVAYSLVEIDSLPEGVTIAESSTSKNATIGIINAKETISVSIVVSNQSTENISLSFSIVNGYKNGGDLTDVSSSYGKTFINSVYQVTPPNAPKLTENLIPVYYDEDASTWKTASYTNENNQWYSYENKKWANAVLLTADKRESLTKDSNGKYVSDQAIGDTYEDGTLAFYVWIPRYKYKVWNIDKTIGVDSYDAQNSGIDIIFEAGTNKTGTIKCNYRFDVTASETVRNEECTGSNGEYYTHPAFTFGDEELTGFWMGKFESSSENPDALYGGNDGQSNKIHVLPNVISWRIGYIGMAWKMIYNMQTENSGYYGLNSDRNLIDSHMITGLEWGAVSYLTNSKYGRCTNNTCTEVGINNSKNYYTGRSAGGAYKESSYYNSYGSYTYDGKTVGTDGTYSDTIISAELGASASTTGNIYGVYDMSAGTNDYVMANMGASSTAGTSYTFFESSANNAEYPEYTYTYEGYEKYLTTYAYASETNSTNLKNQQQINRTRLGDALGEIATGITGANVWHGNYVMPPILYNTSEFVWIYRGSSATSSQYYPYAGIFFSTANNGNGGSTTSSRAILAVFNK